MIAELRAMQWRRVVILTGRDDAYAVKAASELASADTWFPQNRFALGTAQRHPHAAWPRTLHTRRVVHPRG